MKVIHDTKKVNDLFKSREQIHLNPSWQRGPVWAEKKQALLIDSILRGYDIPKIYLRECNTQLPFAYEVVDGQQRLRALWAYLNNEYPLLSDMEKIGDESLAGKLFQQLSDKHKSNLKNFKVVVAYIKDAREPEISKLFSRMQMGVRLNPAELRNAVQTGMRHAIDSTARLHPFFENSRISSKRFKHQDYLAHAVSMCIHHGERDLKAPQLMDDYQNISQEDYMEVISDANEILSFLDDINLLSGKRITQKWMFVDLFYLIYSIKENLEHINHEKFAECYLNFDKKRLEFNSNPEDLIDSEAAPEDRAMYEYIVAFKLSGGEKSQLERRSIALATTFEKVLRD